MNKDVVLRDKSMGKNSGIQLGSEQKLLSDALTIKPLKYPGRRAGSEKEEGKRQSVKTASLCTGTNIVSMHIAEAIFYLLSEREAK